MGGKAAVVFGGTGLVGSELVKELEADARYSAVRLFVRREREHSGGKTEVLVADIADTDSYASEIRGDELFICLGTTIKKAGSIRAMEEADRDLPAAIAEAAVKNGISRAAVVSSIGADAKARSYYLRIKGEMEQLIAAAGFESAVIVRPSMLFGKRNEFRFGEELGKVIMKIFGFLLVGRLRKYRGIKASQVARAVVRLINKPSDPGVLFYESDSLHP